MSTKTGQPHNIPPAAENPDHKTKGRNNKNRVERIQYLRTHEHTLPNGHICEHRLHTVGSAIHQERYDDEGNTILVRLPNAITGYDRPNADGSTRWYVEYPVPCPHGDTTVAIRIDGPGRADSKAWAWTDLMRFYPVGSPQFGVLYGRRNATESVHRQYKRKAVRVPAYGYTRQLLFVLGYVATHNAVARAFHLRRAGKPNALDGILRT
jgi:hypothetical protein